MEYGLILALIALAALGAITSLGVQVTGMWNDIRDAVVSN